MKLFHMLSEDGQIIGKFYLPNKQERLKAVNINSIKHTKNYPYILINITKRADEMRKGKILKVHGKIIKRVK